MAYIQSLPSASHCQVPAWADVKTEWRSENLGWFDRDGEGLFLTCSVWRQAAENVAESLQRGMRVVVQGRLKQRSYEDREGVKRTVYELDVEEVGPSLKNATAKVTKTTGRGGQGGQGGYGGGGQQGGGNWGGGPGGGGQQGGGGAPADDPWATGAPSGGQQGGGGGWGGNPGNSGGSGGGYSDEPPF
nr:single-stranded DNA-binding protein [Streptomyces sp. WAC04770]